MGAALKKPGFLWQVLALVINEKNRTFHQAIIAVGLKKYSWLLSVLNMKWRPSCSFRPTSFGQQWLITDYLIE